MGAELTPLHLELLDHFRTLFHLKLPEQIRTLQNKKLQSIQK
jgi:hypothetical protein